MNPIAPASHPSASCGMDALVCLCPFLRAVSALRILFGYSIQLWLLYSVSAFRVTVYRFKNRVMSNGLFKLLEAGRFYYFDVRFGRTLV